MSPTGVCLSAGTAPTMQLSSPLGRGAHHTPLANTRHMEPIAGLERLGPVKVASCAVCWACGIKSLAATPRSSPKRNACSRPGGVLHVPQFPPCRQPCTRRTAAQSYVLSLQLPPSTMGICHHLWASQRAQSRCCCGRRRAGGLPSGK